MSLKQQNHIGIFLIILVVAAISRLYGLDRLSLWADELWVVVASVSGSLTDMIKSVYYHDNHPPGHYLLVRYTQQVLGSSDFAIRLPSALAGIALVAATFITGRKAFSQNAGMIAAALVAGSYQAIYYSQEARPNIFVALFALLAFHSFRLILLQGDRTLKNYLVFWLSACAASYFHYAGLVFCLCLGLVFVISVAVTRSRENFVTGLKLFLPVLLMYLPWLFGAFRHLVSTPVTAWQRTPDLNTLQTTFRFLFGPDTIRIVFYQIVFATTIVMVIFRARSSRHIQMIAYTLAMIVLPVAVFYIKSLFSQDAYNHRHFLVAAPLMALLAGYYLQEMISRFPEQKQNLLYVAVLVFIVIYQVLVNYGRALYRANHFKQEFREVTQVVAAQDLTKAMIVTNTVFFDHYLNRFTDPPRKTEFVYNWDQKLPALMSLVNDRQVNEFYYLEAPIIPGVAQMITAEDRALAGQYQALCRTRFSRAQVFRFSVTNEKRNVDLSSLPDCRANNPEQK